MVLLKVVNVAIAANSVENLHSTMVLLKGFNLLIHIFKIFLFTFHYGSIKRIRHTVATHLLNRFTFHYGSIKRK